MSKEKWMNPELAEAYADKVEVVDWYEHEVNMPALMELMPVGRVNVLDFGCGPGNFTALLGEQYDIQGSDAAPRMVEIAKEAHPDFEFVVWDGLDEFPTPARQFDTVFSKLTVHFIDDFTPFIDQLDKILRPSGTLVFSVPHPIRSYTKVGGNYFDQAEYDTEIGTYGLHVTMIHRSLEDYIRPFTERGYVLTGLNEPRISDEIAQKYSASTNDKNTSKRLNIRFQKTK